MAIQIIGRPQINLSSGIPSRWTSAAHPIEYTGIAESLNEETRPNYHVIIYLREAGSAVLLARTVRKPFKDGAFRFNVTPYLKKYLLFEDGTPKNSGAVNERDEGKSIEFYIEYQEVDDISGEGVITSDVQNTYHAINSALQIPRREYGQNMADFVPGIQNDFEAKFLSTLPEPKKWEGYPFSLSFIYDSALIGVEVNKKEERRDINKFFINESTYGLNSSNAGSVNQLYIAGNLPANCRYVDVALHSGQIIEQPQGYVAKGYVQEGYFDIPAIAF